MNGRMSKRSLISNFRHDMTGPVVYAAIADFGLPSVKFVKIGHTNELLSRLGGIQTGCPVQIGGVAYARVPSIEQAREVEGLVHRIMGRRKSQGEWFRFDLEDEADKKLWRGGIPAALNHVMGKGRWVLRSIDYAAIRAAAVESGRERSARAFRRHKSRITGTG